ncbi:DUF1460 domain-containing protein [Nocardia cyriacigeorgica]|nr:DUF1460 domain-containing protein [Nocardia cyriacigeorgica]
MRIIVRALLILLALVCGPAVLVPGAVAAPNTDDITARRIDNMLVVRAGAATQSKGELIELLSRQFLGTPYGANMLIGSATEPEQLVVDFRSVDCFTHLDYVEALSRSSTRDEFTTNLIETRYAGGRVEFARRKHFFTDWAHTQRTAATDITATLSPDAITTTVHLNAKADGTTYLPGLPVVERAITHIPSSAVDDAVIAGLRTGDYIGAYADQPGLDVSHVGIFVATPDGPVFRNTSSLPADNKVVDTPLLDYVRATPGILVLRPR